MSLAVKWSVQSQQKRMGKIYSESEPDFPIFSINSLSTFVPIFLNLNLNLILIQCL